MVSVIVPPTGIPESGVNCRTRATVDPATSEVMVMDVNVRAEVDAIEAAIPPEATPADAAVSASVCTVTPVALPAVAAPIVRPLRVMVKAVLGAIETEYGLVMTMELPEMADVAVM